MPGSPPSNTSDPGTSPPPSTRSNSLTPDDTRSDTTVSTSAYKCAPLPPSADTAAPFDATGIAVSSTNEFHAPQSGQRPSHFGDCEPHCWQLKMDLGGFIGIKLGSTQNSELQ